MKTYFSTTSGLAFARDAINNFPNDAIKFLMKHVQVIMNIKNRSYRVIKTMEFKVFDFKPTFYGH